MASGIKMLLEKYQLPFSYQRCFTIKKKILHIAAKDLHVIYKLIYIFTNLTTVVLPLSV